MIHDSHYLRINSALICRSAWRYIPVLHTHPVTPLPSLKDSYFNSLGNRSVFAHRQTRPSAEPRKENGTKNDLLRLFFPLVQVGIDLWLDSALPKYQNSNLP